MNKTQCVCLSTCVTSHLEAEFWGPLTLTKACAMSLLKRMGYTKRKGTTKSSLPPENFLHRFTNNASVHPQKDKHCEDFDAHKLILSAELCDSVRVYHKDKT